jgi:hypothetical protein
LFIPVYKVFDFIRIHLIEKDVLRRLVAAVRSSPLPVFAKKFNDDFRVEALNYAPIRKCGLFSLSAVLACGSEGAESAVLITTAE